MKQHASRHSSVILLFFAVLLLSPASILFAGGAAEQEDADVTGADGDNPEIDYLGVAAVMVRDGNYERAETALGKVDPDAEGVDTARFYTLRGLLRLRRANFEEAASDFQQAIENGQEDSVIYVYLAQAQFGLQNYRETVEAINQVQGLTQYPDLLGIRSQALWEQGRQAEAYAAIQRAVDLYPSRSRFLRQQIFYLIELDLTQAAADLSEQYFERAGNTPEAYTTIGEAFRRAGLSERAIQTMEMANLLFERNERVSLSLAQAYLEDEKPLVAARIIEESAAFNVELYYEAAELYRRAGDVRRALYLNSQVVDQERKTRQRFNLLVGSQQYEQALSLEPRLQRYGAFEDDAMLYAMAYVHFQTQNFEEAVSYTNRISGSEYFRQASQLRQAIETVRNQDVQFF